jgi:hypothetical protein
VARNLELGFIIGLVSRHGLGLARSFTLDNLRQKVNFCDKA